MRLLFIAGLLSLTAASASWAMSHGHKGHMQHKMGASEFQTVTQDGITASHFRARARIGMAPNSAAYGSISIASGSDTLVSVSSSLVDRVELHEHIHDNGVMRMREVSGGLQVSAAEPLVMKPGGYHIMLLGLTGPLDAGTMLDLSLRFESGKTLDLRIPVMQVTAMQH